MENFEQPSAIEAYQPTHHPEDGLEQYVESEVDKCTNLRMAQFRNDVFKQLKKFKKDCKDEITKTIQNEQSYDSVGVRGYYPNPQKLKSKKDQGLTYNIELNAKNVKNFEYQSQVHNRYSSNYLDSLKQK